MRKIIIIFFAALILGFGVSSASATTITLAEHGLNKDGTVTTPSFTGLGTITATVSGTGPHYVLFFVDNEIDEGTNTFFNEYGAANGSLGTGQSWQLDDPYGTIYDNFVGGTLDNTNHVSAPAIPEEQWDVSMALGWNFSLNAGETATVTLTVTDTLKGTPPFYLSQTDPESNESDGYTIYYYGDLSISGGGTPVPEPGMLILLALGLFGIAGLRRNTTKE